MGAIVVGPGARRALLYRIQLSNPVTAAKLSIEPQIVKPIAPVNTDKIDTFYSTFSVPSGIYTRLESHETWLVLTGRQDAEILLNEIGYPSELSADGNFTFYSDAISVRPATSWQVFSMSETEFATHVKLILGKAATPYADRDVSLFETPSTKGIIRYGSAEHFPSVTNIAIWDKTNPICQEITITVADPELRDQMAKCIAATYSFKLDVAPDRDKILPLVERAVAAFNRKTGEQSVEPELPSTVSH